MPNPTGKMPERLAKMWPLETITCEELGKIEPGPTVGDMKRWGFEGAPPGVWRKKAKGPPV